MRKNNDFFLAVIQSPPVGMMEQKQQRITVSLLKLNYRVDLLTIFYNNKTEQKHGVFNLQQPILTVTVEFELEL